MATIKCSVTKSSWYEMYIEYTVSQNPKTAISTISHALKLKQLTDSYDFSGTMNVSYTIGSDTFPFSGTVNIDDKGNKGYTVTIASGTSYIQHNKTSGAGSFYVACSGSCPSGGYGPGTISLAGYYQTLPTIDRAAPTVTHSVSNITASSITITANSSVWADEWWYSLDGGKTWVGFSTTGAYSQTVTVNNLSPNTTYGIRVCARKSSNDVDGYSTSANVTTLGNALLNSVSGVIADSTTVNIVFNWTVYSNAFTYVLDVKNGSTVILSIALPAANAGTTNKTVTLTSAQRTALLTYMSALSSFTATFELTTKSGSTTIGNIASRQAVISTLEANSAPVFEGFTFKDDNPYTVYATLNEQYLLKDYSKLLITCIPATARNCASISSYTATIGNHTRTSATPIIDVGAVSTADTLECTVTVTDSRGYTTEVSCNIIVLDYSAPKIDSYTLRRENDIDDNIQLTLKGSMSKVMIGDVNNNSLYIARYRYKRTDESEWTEFFSILSQVEQLSSGTSFEFTETELISLDTDFSWDFHIQIMDQCREGTVFNEYAIISPGTPHISIRKKKVGINNKDPRAALDVVGGFILDGVELNNIVEWGTVGIWNYIKLKNGYAECWGTTESKSVTYNSNWYNTSYYVHQTYDFPANLFVSPPSFVDIKTICSSGIHENSLQEVQAENVAWYSISIANKADLTYSLKYMICAKGRWKHENS